MWPWRPGTSTSVASPLDGTLIDAARPIAIDRTEDRPEGELCADDSREPDDVTKLENST